jgi:anti-sigma B factor antagonist
MQPMTDASQRFSGLGTGGSGLAVAVAEEGPEFAVATVSGELDMATEPEFSARIGAQLTVHRRIMVLDLDGLSFVGSAGLKALVELQQRAQQRNIRLRVVVGQSPAGRLLELTGLRTTFALFDTVATARQAD